MGYVSLQRLRTLQWAILILLLVVGLWGLFWILRDDENLTSGEEENDNHSSSFPVEVTGVSFERVEHYLEAVGSLLPEDEVTISAEVEGIIKQRNVDEGDLVQRGDLLLRIDDEKFRLQVEEAEASLREAQASLKNAEATLRRMKQLLEEKVIDQQKYDDAVTQFSLSTAVVENTEAKLHRYRRILKDTRVLSPLDGVVSERMVSEGEYVKVGTELLKIVETNPLKLSFALPEKFSGQLQIGQSVEVETKAFPGEVFRGTVYFISPKVNLSTRTVEVKAKVSNSDYRLKPGFFVQVKLLTGVNEQAMVLPEGAVLMRDGQFVVLSVQDGRVKVKPIVTGRRFENRVEVLGGIESSEVVVVGGLGELRDGSKVRIINQPQGVQG